MEKTPIAVEVPLGDRAYQALVGPGQLGQVGGHLDALNLGKRCAVITDDTVGPFYGKMLLTGLRDCGYEANLLEVVAGEPSKSVAIAESLCRRMIQHGCDRHTFVVALGGGVIGDLAGFVAGIFYRGIPYVQIPTTIVSQVDSSVGGKTGVNAPEGKNLIGVFHQPRLVVADTDTLATLPDREFREGFAEVIKHAAIRDASMVPLITAVLENRTSHLPELMARNIAIKAKIVEEDERETTGTRALLNFGHTIGHAIEAAAGYGRFLHGEAISLGLRAAANLSCEFSGLPSADRDELLRLLKAFDLPLVLPDDLEDRAILDYLARDKKFEKGKIRFVLLRGFGDAFLSDQVTLAAIERAIAQLREPPSA